LIGAALIVATGIRAREDSSAKLREWTEAQAIPTVAVALPSGKALSPTIDLPGRLEGLFARADFCARQRLSQKLERRHRRRGQGQAR
jgi:hypothetical protein